MILNKLIPPLTDLMEECESAIFCISSASHKSSFYDCFMKHKHKLKNLVIGTHNFSTTPDFLANIRDVENTTLLLSNPNYMKKDLTFNVNLYMFFMPDHSWILINSSTGLVSSEKTRKILQMNSLFDSEDLTTDDANQIMSTFLSSLKEYITLGQDLKEQNIKKYTALFKSHHTYVNNYRLEDLTSQMLDTSKSIASKTLQTTEKIEK